MTKKVWAKGRKKQIIIAVDEETRELARKLALEERLTIKDIVKDALRYWDKYVIQNGNSS
jgi:hypothetical protein